MALGKQGLEPIEHGIPPVFDGRSEVLVLGAMPSPASRPRSCPPQARPTPPGRCRGSLRPTVPWPRR